MPLEDSDSDEDDYSWSESDHNDKNDNDSINSGAEDVILAFIGDEEEVERPATTRSGRSIKRRSEIDFSLFWFTIFFYVWKIVKKCLSKWTEFIFWINRSGCYICRMSCQQLYIEQKIQIILYTAKYMHVRFNYDNVSFESWGGRVTPKKWPSLGGGGLRENEDWVGGAMVIRNGGSKNSTSTPTS